MFYLPSLLRLPVRAFITFRISRYINLINKYPFKFPTNNFYFQNTFIANKCDGSCGQGEGDCDWNSDCLPGLICDWDWWWGTDYCEPGKTLQNTFPDESSKIHIILHGYQNSKRVVGTF